MKKFLVVAAMMLLGGTVQHVWADDAPAQVAPAETAPEQVGPVQAEQTLDLSTPEAAIRSYVAALNKADLRRAARCVEGTHLEGKWPPLLEEFQKGYAFEGMKITVKNLRVEPNGDNALVSVQTDLSMGKQHEVQMQALRLHREGGSWKIAVNDPKTALAGIMHRQPHVLTGMAAVLINPKLLLVARAEGRAGSCRSNLQQLALGVVQLMEDYDGKFALKAAAFQKALRPYVGEKQIFICPEDEYDPSLQGSKKVVSSYSFNPKLEGVSLGKIKHPEATVMIYEGKGGKLNFRHNGRAGVAYVDGHVRLVTAQQAKSLNWKP